MTSSNIDTFIKEAVSVPKVLLFTDKTGTPTIFKGLSITFEVILFNNYLIYIILILVKIIFWYC